MAFGFFLSKVPLGMIAAPVAGVSGSNRLGHNVLLAASLGRASGGVHGYRSGKGRRRRSPGSDSQDEAFQCKSHADGPPDSSSSSKNGNTGKRSRKRSSKLDEEPSVTSSLSTEEVAPVAMTILTAPEMFKSSSQDSSSNGSLNGTGHDEQVGDASEGLPVATPLEIKLPMPTTTDAEKSEETHDGTSIQTQVVEQAGQVAQAAEALVEQVTEQVTSLLSSSEPQDEQSESDDEFEAYTTSDLPEFRGIRGLENFTVLQENYGIVSLFYDFYLYILKKPVPEFALAMFAAPVALSMLFTLLYLPQIQGLAFGDAASHYDHASGEGLCLSWAAVFQVFMFSVSLSTGLQPELAPVTPYTLVVANINALVAQLVFVFLSGAVFARLSQPSQPIRCSSVALVSPLASKRGGRTFRVFMARYVLVGPQPSELVDVKVDLSYKYNTITRAGTYFRATQSLKLIRSEVAYLNHGMLVRHIIDDTSALNKRTPELLRNEDGIFTLSVVGLERSSMQPVFHVQHYSIVDDHVVWDAEFEDMILISRKNRRIVDHSRLSQWRPL